MHNSTDLARTYESLGPVIEKLARFDEPDLLAQIAASQAEFRKECLVRNRCLDEEVVTILPLIALTYEHLCFVSAFQRVDRDQLAERLEYKIAYELVTARGLRAAVKTIADSNFYFTRLEDPAMAAMAAIATGSDHAAQWMCKEFLRHYDAEQLNGSYDEEILAFCALLAEWHLHSRIDARRRERAAVRAYRELAELAGHAADNVSSAIRSFVSWRVDESTRQLVQERGKNRNVSGDLYFALFPFEVMAFAQLSQRGSAIAIDRSMSDPPWLSGLTFTRKPMSDGFISEVSEKLDDLRLNECSTSWTR